LRSYLIDAKVDAGALILSDGDVVKAISHAAADKKADLLVIGRNCPSGATHRFSTHTYGLICSAPCPVVSI